MSDHSADLPVAAALSAGDRAGLVNALKDKLQLLAGEHVDILETLSPKFKQRVEVLKVLQSEHDELEKKFLEERAQLEAKYQKLYEPLYTKRYEIVNGVIEVEGITDETVLGEANPLQQENSSSRTSYQNLEIITPERLQPKSENSNNIPSSFSFQASTLTFSNKFRLTDP